jgi:hypothetical protein
MEDDGGSTLTNGVSRDIKAAIQKAVQHLTSAHGIKANKVNQTYVSEHASSFKLKRQVKENT